MASMFPIMEGDQMTVMYNQVLHTFHRCAAYALASLHHVIQNYNGRQVLSFELCEQCNRCCELVINY